MLILTANLGQEANRDTWNDDRETWRKQTAFENQRKWWEEQKY